MASKTMIRRIEGGQIANIVICCHRRVTGDSKGKGIERYLGKVCDRCIQELNIQDRSNLWTALMEIRNLLWEGGDCFLEQQNYFYHIWLQDVCHNFVKIMVPFNERIFLCWATTQRIMSGCAWRNVCHCLRLYGNAK